MNNLVEFSFTMVAYSIIAVIFYGIFFGASFIKFDDGSTYDGLIFYICRASENSMGYLYYEYVFQPTVHGTDSIDLELLRNVVNNTYDANSISTEIGQAGVSTESDLSQVNVINGEDKASFANIVFPLHNSTNGYYSSGWH